MDKIKQAIVWTKKNRKPLYTAAAILAIAAAALFFGEYGKTEGISWYSDGKETVENEEKNTEKKEAGSAQDKSSAAASELIYVDVEGEINNPGVYEADKKTRVFQIINKAGGFTEQADPSLINQAEIVEDGELIRVPAKGEADAASAASSSDGTASASSSDLVNINTADASKLQEIPGVGPSIAEKIVEYRTSNGRFRKIEDIKNVSGIGEKTFDKMKSHLTV